MTIGVRISPIHFDSLLDNGESPIAREMASRQPQPPDMAQQPMDDEQFSAPGEGDEIMEEPEEQEDGCCTSIFRIA